MNVPTELWVGSEEETSQCQGNCVYKDIRASTTSVSKVEYGSKKWGTGMRPDTYIVLGSEQRKSLQENRYREWRPKT